jgi:tripartite-type tricarboxylate transporter receptor subunit TctC
MTLERTAVTATAVASTAVALTAAAASLFGLSALAQDARTFPSKAIHIIVGNAAGGGTDYLARLVGQKMSERLGQAVVIENKPGANSTIAVQHVDKSPPDGHTLLMGQTGEIAINQHWIKGLTYNAEKDLMPIALASVVPLALVVPAKAPYSTMADLAKALTEKQLLTFASAGTGTPGHFAGEVLKLKTRSNFTHVPYNGAGPALNDLLGGHVDLFFSGFPPTVSHVKAGTLKLLAVSSARRSAALVNRSPIRPVNEPASLRNTWSARTT